MVPVSVGRRWWKWVRTYVMKCPAFVGIETAFVEKDTIFDCEIRHIRPRRFSRDFGDSILVDLAP